MENVFFEEVTALVIGKRAGAVDVGEVLGVEIYGNLEDEVGIKLEMEWLEIMKLCAIFFTQNATVFSKFSILISALYQG